MIGVPPAIVGRDQELARLGLTVDATLAGQPSFLLVLGEAGIGKTTLLTAALAMARQRGLRSLRGVAMESGSSLPYLPLLAPLAECVTDDPDHPSCGLVRAELLGEIAPEPDPDGGRDDARAARLVEAVYRLISARPTLLAVDDIQWADPATLAILDYISHRAVDVPLAIVAAARDDDPDRIERLAIADARRFVHLPVGPLRRDAVALQLATLGGTPSTDDVDAIYARTAGNPFFVEQVHAAAVESGSVRGATPGSLQLLVLRRIGRLPPGSRAVLDGLAVLDRPVATGLVAATAGLGIEATRSGIEAAVRARVAEPVEEGVRLRHPVFGEVLRAQLPGPEHAELHRRAADALEAEGGDAATIAEHRWQAGDPGPAWSAALAAADELAGRFAFGGVRLHLERALQLWPPDTPGRAAAALRAGKAAWNEGDPRAAVEHARTAEAALPDPGVNPIEVLLAQGAYAWDAGERSAADSAFDRVHELIGPDTPAVLRSRALWGRGRAEISHRRLDDAHRLGLEAAVVAREAGELTHEAEALLLAGMAVAWAGTESNVDILERGLEVALASGSPDTIGHAHQFVADMRWLNGDLDRAVEVALRGIELCERLGLARSHGADLRGNAGFWLLELGRPAEAATVLADADPRALTEFASARLAMRLGEFDRARAALDRVPTAGGIGGPGIRGGWPELTEAELAVLRGDLQSSTESLDRVVLAPGIWGIDAGAWRMLWAARIAADQRRAPAPMTSADLVEGPPESHPDTALARAIRSELAALVGLDGDGGGRRLPPELVDRWREAVADWTGARRPYEACRARLGEVGALLSLGHRADAKTALRAATEVAEGLGCRPLVEAATDLARRSRIGLVVTRRGRPDPNEPTRRELEVLAHLAEGLTNPQIATRLFLSPKTVGIHVSRILEKLGAHTRGEAVAIARRRRLL
jgi:DNA-binding CsgD family transcriptional regulator